MLMFCMVSTIVQFFLAFSEHRHQRPADGLGLLNCKACRHVDVQIGGVNGGAMYR